MPGGKGEVILQEFQGNVKPKRDCCEESVGRLVGNRLGGEKIVNETLRKGIE